MLEADTGGLVRGAAGALREGEGGRGGERDAKSGAWDAARRASYEAGSGGERWMGCHRHAPAARGRRDKRILHRVAAPLPSPSPLNVAVAVDEGAG